MKDNHTPPAGSGTDAVRAVMTAVCETADTASAGMDRAAKALAMAATAETTAAENKAGANEAGANEAEAEAAASKAVAEASEATAEASEATAAASKVVAETNETTAETNEAAAAASKAAASEAATAPRPSARRLKGAARIIGPDSWPLSYDDTFDVLLRLVGEVIADDGHEPRYTQTVEMLLTETARWLTTGAPAGYGLRPWLCYCGLHGNGKTTLLRALGQLLQQMKDRGWLRPRSQRTTFLLKVTAAEVEQTRRSAHYEQPDTCRLWEELCTADCLLIDDLGEETITHLRFGREEICPVAELLTRRYDERLLTVMTTNLRPEMITERDVPQGSHECLRPSPIYGLRVASRWREMTHHVITGLAPDYRLAGMPPTAETITC